MASASLEVTGLREELGKDLALLKAPFYLRTSCCSETQSGVGRVGQVCNHKTMGSFHELNAHCDAKRKKALANYTVFTRHLEVFVCLVRMDWVEGG